ncbi:MAG: response regulator transcription factor [Brumimicrobium sp.]|nr:response regulator transcription factor [Brumimicrobium sp.]MCO5268877.1 LytTR family DNA-binding domain-containing protein [Brumimicrobium sp.]
MKAIIIDDERLARQELRLLLKDFSSSIEVIGEASNGEEGIAMIQKHQPDLIFLDIQMPDMNGFNMLSKLEEIPKVIFVSAYDEYALDAFRVNALDYLLKPVDPSQLKNAIDKISNDTESDFYSPVKNERENRLLTNEDRIFIKDGEKYFFPYLNEIKYFESQGNYVKVYFKENKPMVLRSLNAIEDKLSSENFFRANRKYLVNISAIKNVENWFNGGLKAILEDDTEVEISRRQARRFKDIMSL